MDNLIKFITDEKTLRAILVAIIGIMIYLIVGKILEAISNRKNSSMGKKRRTYIRLFKSLFKYSMLILIVAMILRIYGVDVSAIVAGLGIASVIAGLALQDAFKDIIMGFNLVVDNYFSVGDVLKINGIEGRILEIGIKTTKMQDIDNGNIYVVANRNISEALNISNRLDIDIPLPYEKNVTEVEKVLEKIIKQIEKIKEISKVEYIGIEEFAGSAILYRIRVYSKPELRHEVKRISNNIIKVVLDENNMSIPYSQVDVHLKK